MTPEGLGLEHDEEREILPKANLDDGSLVYC
jgi:hypothetical protein